MLVALGESGVKTLDDVADLAADELMEMLGSLTPTPDEANAIVMAARKHWFPDEAGGAGTGEDAEATEAAKAG
jgi:N utilization substance protein A